MIRSSYSSRNLVKQPKAQPTNAPVNDSDAAADQAPNSGAMKQLASLLSSKFKNAKNAGGAGALTAAMKKSKGKSLQSKLPKGVTA